MSIEATANHGLVARWIRPVREHPGDPDARIVDTGIPVWAVVGNYNAARGDIEASAADYHLPREAMEAVLEYYRLHREVIDARLAANTWDAE